MNSWGDMKPIQTALLKPGMVLQQDLCDSTGKVLLSKGTLLTSKHLESLKTRGALRLFTNQQSSTDSGSQPASPAFDSSLILVAEDDEDDYLLLKDVLNEAEIDQNLKWFKDGEEILRFLFSNEKLGQGKKKKIKIIFLDINMPRKNGFEVLKEIKSHSNLRMIPIIMLSTSGDKSDINLAYQLGANSYIKKPKYYSEYLTIIKQVKEYWFKAVLLPVK